jgi:LytTr DNA-binding domain
MSLIRILGEPFPFNYSRSNNLRSAGYFGGFITAFLLLFKPFDLDQFGTMQLVIIAFTYGAVTFSCIIICNILFPRLFPAAFKESEWTTGKQILFIMVTVLLVGIVNYLISPALVDTELNLYYAFWFQGITLTIALLPVTLYILFRQNRLLKKFTEEARNIESKLEDKKKVIRESESINEREQSKITLAGDYQDEKISLWPHELYMVESASNYIKVYHLQKDKLVYTIIRSTMKKTEEMLAPYIIFLKCHRSYIINLDKVEHVAGNAQGYKIKIENHDSLIPVSRSLNTEFSDKLLAVQQSK